MKKQGGNGSSNIGSYGRPESATRVVEQFSALQLDQPEKSEEEDLNDIDLKDPELEKAAIKIQSTFKGFQSRKKKTGN